MATLLTVGGRKGPGLNLLISPEFDGQKCVTGSSRHQISGWTSIPASLRCSAAIGAGASVSGSPPPPDFGKAITSRIESLPDKSAHIRSQPKAIPPCGGGP